MVRVGGVYCFWQLSCRSGGPANSPASLTAVQIFCMVNLAEKFSRLKFFELSLYSDVLDNTELAFLLKRTMSIPLNWIPAGMLFIENITDIVLFGLRSRLRQIRPRVRTLSRDTNPEGLVFSLFLVEFESTKLWRVDEATFVRIFEALQSLNCHLILHADEAYILEPALALRPRVIISIAFCNNCFIVMRYAYNDPTRFLLSYSEIHHPLDL